MECSIYKGKTKKEKKDFECLKIKIGEYETLIFPTKIEMIYIKHILEENAHKEFQESEK